MDWMTGQPAISPLRAAAFPSPHHASRTPASEILCPEKPVQAGKEGSKGRIEQTKTVSPNDPIERDDPGPPTQPHHGAPHVFLCVLLEYKHFTLLVGLSRSGPDHRGVTAAPCGAGMPPGRSRQNVQFILAPSFEFVVSRGQPRCCLSSRKIARI